MRSTLDWKYFTTLIIAFAGVVVPVFIWQADFNSRSIQLQIFSQTLLDPDVPKAVSGLRISMDGTDLDRPYLTVIELKNNGDRPILATDYEEEIQIIVDNGARLVRAQLTETAPQDVQPLFTNNDKFLKINPLLLNPNDSMTFSLITDGEKPFFKTRARISGIKFIELEDKSVYLPDSTLIAFRVILVFIYFFVYSYFWDIFLRRIHIEITRLISALVAFSSCISGVTTLMKISKDFSLSIFSTLLFLSLVVLISIFVATFVRREQLKKPE